MLQHFLLTARIQKRSQAEFSEESMDSIRHKWPWRERKALREPRRAPQMTEELWGELRVWEQQQGTEDQKSGEA